MYNNPVPVNDLPDDLVPAGDIPDNPVPQEDLPDTLQGQVQKSPNVLEDMGRGALSGVSEIPRAVATLGGNALRSMFGKEPLTEEQKNEALSRVGMADYKPQTTVGGVAKFAGEIVPYMLTKAETALPQTVIGGVQGFSSAVNNNENPLLGIAKGSVTGLVGHGVAKGVGKAFETAQPYIAEKMAGIPRSAYKEALNNPEFFNGKWNKNDIQKGLKEAEKQAGKDVGESILNLSGQKPYDYQNVDDELQQVINDSYRGASTSSQYEAAKNTIDKAKNIHFETPILENISRQTGIPTEVLKTKDLNLQQMNQNISSYLKQNKIQELEQKYGFDKGQLQQYMDEGFTPEQLGIKPEDLKMKTITITPEDLTVTPSNLHQFKETVQGAINFNSPETKLGSKLLKPLQEKAASFIEKDSPDYKQANALYSAIKDALGRDSFDNTKGQLFNFQNIKEAYKKANPDMPTDVTNTIMDKIKNSTTADEFIKEMDVLNKRGYFEKVLPNQGTTDFKPLAKGEGVLGVYSGISALHGNIIPLLMQIAGSAGVSPLSQKVILQGYKQGSKLSPYYTRVLQQVINNMGANNEAQRSTNTK